MKSVKLRREEKCKTTSEKKNIIIAQHRLKCSRKSRPDEKQENRTVDYSEQREMLTSTYTHKPCYEKMSNIYSKIDILPIIIIIPSLKYFLFQSSSCLLACYSHFFLLVCGSVCCCYSFYMLLVVINAARSHGTLLATAF